MSKIRFKYTKNGTYKCTRCGEEYSELPLYCQPCALDLMAQADANGKLPDDYYELFSPDVRDMKL